MKYKKIITGLFALIITTSQASAQMGEAQKIVLDSDTSISLDASVDKVWQLIKDPAKWGEFSNGKISSVTTKGNLNTLLRRTITFSDGSIRTDEVTQFTPEYRFIVNRVVGPLPDGISENIYMFSVSLDPGKGAILKYSIKVDGKPEGKKVLLETLKKEMNDFIIGIQKALEKNPG